MTGNNVELAYVDQGYIEPNAAAAARAAARGSQAPDGQAWLCATATAFPGRSFSGISILMTESKPDVSDKGVKTAPS